MLTIPITLNPKSLNPNPINPKVNSAPPIYERWGRAGAVGGVGACLAHPEPASFPNEQKRGGGASPARGTDLVSRQKM